MLFLAALVPPPSRPAVRSHAPAARRMTAIPVSRLRPPNVSILFGVAAPPAEDDARAIDDRARASPSCLLVELALRPSSSAAGETAAEGGGRVTLARRACAPRWEFLFRLDAREAATSRGVVTVLDPSVRSHSGGCVLARVELPALPAVRGGGAGGGGLPATRVDPPVAPATVACPVASQSPSRLHLLPSPAAPLWVDRAEALVRDPPRALALSRVAQLLLLLDVCVVALFVLFAGSSRRRRRSRVEMEDDLADDADAAPETRARPRAATPTAKFHASPSSPSLSSFSSSSERGTTALARAEETVFPDDDPPSPSFLPTATPPRWNIVADVDAPCDPHERVDWSISAVVREDVTHGGVEETDLVTAFLAAPPRPCGRDRNLDPNVEASEDRDDASFEDDEDRDASFEDDEDGLLCREEAVPVVVPAPGEKSKSRLARRRASPPFRLKMWGRSMPGATARLLLRDLRRCAQFAGATMRTFAPGTFESPSPRLPRSVAPAAPETAASAPAGVATIGSAATAAARGGGRRGWAAAMREFAAAAAPPATAADADADANDLFRDGWEGSRRDSKGRLAKVSGAKPAGW